MVCGVARRRNDNLNSRASGKAERKKQKREAKLLRPGFEGRRAGPLGS